MSYRVVVWLCVVVWWLSGCSAPGDGALQMSAQRLAAETNGVVRTLGESGIAEKTLAVGVSYPTHGQSFSGLSVPLWPDGKIPYHVENLNDDDLSTVLQGMAIWEQSTHNIVQFLPCHPTGASGLPLCPKQHLNIRYRTVREINDGYTSHSCTTGHVGEPQLRFNPNFDIGVALALHELGHCIGIAHEHSRADNARWLPQAEFAGALPTDQLPLLGNYAYDSALHYTQFKVGEVTYKATDYFGHLLQWQATLSAWDVSRVMQYYAYESNENWGIFMSLNGIPSLSKLLPDPYLATGDNGTKVTAVGSPAISHQLAGSFDLFVLGSDQQLYWKSIRQTVVSVWQPLALPSGGRTPGSMGSEPAAISSREGYIDVFAVDAQGRLMWRSYRHGLWGAWGVVGTGAPADGIAQHLDGSGRYIGPAVAARADGTFDVFVVSQGGRLATSHFANGGWGAWQLLGARGQYVVSARPAALSLSGARIQLAINTRFGALYEPLVNYDTTNEATLSLGAAKAQMKPETPPALTRRDDSAHPYRVLIVDKDGHLAHRFSGASTWRKIGGVLRDKTGPTAVAEGPYGAWIAIHGPDVTGCTQNCKDPSQAGQIIQPGGLWLRRFK